MEVMDYLLEQVFRDQPAKIKNFLLQTSVLDRFNGDLADAVSTRGDSWQIIEYLHRHNLFLFFLDKEGQWCRYHHLFADFLKERLRRSGRCLSESAHERAAIWFNQHGLVREAVTHALQSSNLELVAAIVEEAGGWRMAITGNQSILRRVISRLPEVILHRYPRLWLGAVLISAKTGRLYDAQRKLRELEWQEAGAGEANQQAIAERIAISVLIAGYEDRLMNRHDLEELEKLVRQPQFDDDLVLVLLNNYLCLLYLGSGKFAQSIEAGVICKNFFLQREDAYGGNIIDIHTGQSVLALGRLAEAKAIFEQIYNFSRCYVDDTGDAAAIASVLLAETAYEQNDLASSEEYLDRSLHHIEKFDSWLDIYASAYITAASVAHASTGIDASMTILDRAEEVAGRRNLDRLGRLVRLTRIRELVLQGDLRTAETFAQEFEPFEEAELPCGTELPNWRLIEAAALSLADVSILGGNPQRAIAILAPRVAEAEKNKWIRSTIKLLIKLALSLDACGNRKAALEAVERSLLYAAPQNFIRCYLVEGKPMRSLLGALPKNQTTIPVVKVFVDTVLGERAQGKVLFGDRQKEILDLLIKGCSTKEMAFRLGLSANTIKFHRKKLFEKLGARSRSQAIAAARKLSL
jgi:LuxR family maltose regulon positive regulatory protein